MTFSSEVMFCNGADFEKKNDVEHIVSIRELIQKCCKKYSERAAFIVEKRRVSYNELLNDITALGPCFQKKGKNYYLIKCVNQYHYAIALLSCIMYGQIAVLTNSIESLNERCSVVDDSLICECLAAEDPERIEFQNENPDDPAIIVSSSGTTRKSKAVILSQRNLCADVVSTMETHCFSENDVYFHLLPYEHVFGLIGDLLIPLHSGGTVFIPKSRLHFFSELVSSDATTLLVPPVVVIALLNEINYLGKREVIGMRLKKIICSGASLHESYYRDFEEIGVKVFSAYGLTECTATVAIDDDCHKSDSCGRIITCNKVKIEDGDIFVQGENVMLGYYQDQQIKRDDWIRTGDYGYIDNDGYLFVQGRRDRVLVFADGSKLYPEEVEEELCRSELITECQVFRPAEAQDNMYMVVVVTSHESLFSAAKREVLSRMKDYVNVMPKQVLCTVHPLPRTAIGKTVLLTEDMFRELGDEKSGGD